MDKKIFNKEDEIYSTLYKEDYGEGRWRTLATVIEAYTFLQKIVTIIDLGCGIGAAIRYFRKKGYQCHGVDISEYACSQLKASYTVFHASLDDLSFLQPSSYDIVFCSDVLEHLKEEYLENTLKEMCRICKKTVFISVTMSPSSFLSFENENLHRVVWDFKKWHDFFRKFSCSFAIKNSDEAIFVIDRFKRGFISKKLRAYLAYLNLSFLRLKIEIFNIKSYVQKKNRR